MSRQRRIKRLMSMLAYKKRQRKAAFHWNPRMDQFNLNRIYFSELDQVVIDDQTYVIEQKMFTPDGFHVRMDAK